MSLIDGQHGSAPADHPYLFLQVIRGGYSALIGMGEVSNKALPQYIDVLYTPFSPLVRIYVRSACLIRFYVSNPFGKIPVDEEK